MRRTHSRSKLRWVIVRAPLCAGLNVEGQGCRREAAVGSRYCSLHADQDVPAPALRARHWFNDDICGRRGIVFKALGWGSFPSVIELADAWPRVKALYNSERSTKFECAWNWLTDDDKYMWLRRIDRLIDPRVALGRKGIIHTVSYQRTKELITQSDHKKWMLVHDSANTREIIQQFKNAEGPWILVSPSIVTGYDFPGDQCRYQIIAKVPIPDMRGPIMSRRKELDPEYAGYADPPYLGCGKLYPEHPESRVWDSIDRHIELVNDLVAEFPDGWALSLSMPSLRHILPACPSDARVAPWCKSFCAFKKGVRPCYAWEPVIYWGGRNPPHGHPHKPPLKGGKQTTPKDFLLAPITLKKGLTGAKSELFCEWVLDLLNFQPGDDLIDVFPGTGVMTTVVERRRAA
jgi:hypothetical protein